MSYKYHNNFALSFYLNNHLNSNTKFAFKPFDSDFQIGGEANFEKAHLNSWKFGTLFEKIDGVIVKFVATIVWKNGIHLGIKFHEEIIVPDIILALQMAYAE